MSAVGVRGAAALVACLAACAAGAAGAVGLRVDPGWSGDRIWDDGQAEVAHYDARRSVYGVERSFETVMITVKEDFDARAGVKADPPWEGRSLVTVLKLNLMSRIQTENYPYSYMTSVFARRDDVRALVKLAHSSQEWCGTTFKEIIGWDGPPRLQWHSYFDGEADGQAPLALGPAAYLEEQLFLVLRSAQIDPGGPTPLTIYDSLITNNARSLSARAMSLTIHPEETLTVPAGSFQARRLALTPLDGKGATLTFWREAAPRRAILRFESGDGRALLLREIERRDYWSR